MFIFYTLFVMLYVGGCTLSICSQISESGHIDIGTTIIEAWLTTITVGATICTLYIIYNVVAALFL